MQQYESSIFSIWGRGGGEGLTSRDFLGITNVPLPQGTSMAVHWVYSDLNQWYCWCKSAWTCEGVLSLGKGWEPIPFWGLICPPCSHCYPVPPSSHPHFTPSHLPHTLCTVLPAVVGSPGPLPHEALLLITSGALQAEFSDIMFVTAGKCVTPSEHAFQQHA